MGNRFGKTFSAREIIKKEYGSSKNLMTGDILRYGKIKRNKAFELSKGRGFSGKTLYGVSIASISKHGKTRRNYSQSKVFFSKEKAENYIERLKKKRKQPDIPKKYPSGNTISEGIRKGIRTRMPKVF